MCPGFIVLGFFVLSFFIRNIPGWLKSLRLTGFILFLCSLGPYTLGIPWKIPLPFNLLWYLYPPLQATRNPHRLSLFVILITSILAAFIVEKIKISKSMKRIVVILLVLGISLESLGVVKPGRALRPEARTFYEKLDNKDRKYTIIELPINIHTDIRAMVSSCYHWNPLINGVSGVWPPLQSQLEGEMRQFPDTHTIRLLQSLEVNRVVIHEAQYGKERKQLIRKLLRRSEITFIFREGMLSLWALKPGRVRQEFDGKRDLELSGPGKGVAGEINLSLNAGPADETFRFNLKAPSRFGFTPSRLWGVRIRLKDSEWVLKEYNWRAPALFHLFNRSKRIELDLPPGLHQLEIEVDMMGEKIRIPSGIEVVPGQDPGIDLPSALKLPRGYSGVPLESLRVDLKTKNELPTLTVDRRGVLFLRVGVGNPGPYYWKNRTGQGVFLGVIIRHDQKARIHEFALPNDLFPGDEATVPVHIALPPENERFDFIMNCFIKNEEKNVRWFPEGNRIRIYCNQKR